MAFQLREAIYRLDAGRDLARHLAIPQNDQGGDRTDWYSSFPGDVIPWSGASEAERESARQQFNAFQMAVQSLSEQLLNAEQSGTGGDRRVFAQLLKSVTHFPDYEFVYLVNGTLVITFWGFVHPEGEQRHPMHWLSSSSVPAAALAAVPPQACATEKTVEPAPTPFVDIRTRRWCWRWLLWLLLALLLLALLFGLPHGCAPSLSLPDLPGLSADKTTVTAEPVVAQQATSPHDVALRGSETAVGARAVPGGIVEWSTADAHSALDSTVPAMPTDASDNAVDGDATPPAGANEASVEPPLPPSVPDTHDEPTRPGVTTVTAQPLVAPQGEPLTLPATLPEGPAKFLNGEWRVNGGIQDKHTGRPLQLQYNFDQGHGTVSVRQSSGVMCRGPTSGNVQQGALNITNPEQMTCSDGSNFIVPTIECKSPSAGHADCIGSNNGEKTFPIRMLQPNS
ncbi:hypothetical protein G3577_17540 [Morganella morganii]|nr:hypothetical protein [Morganella morganii]QIC14153.1 hypothetical protein G3577_17540 [Morganella morganii]